LITAGLCLHVARLSAPSAPIDGGGAEVPGGAGVQVVNVAPGMDFDRFSIARSGAAIRPPRCRHAWRAGAGARGLPSVIRTQRLTFIRLLVAQRERERGNKTIAGDACL
jgi:hypothetical protein